MSSLEIFLWPALGFLVVAALASLWQVRNSAAEAAAAGKRRAAVLGALAAAILAYLLLEAEA